MKRALIAIFTACTLFFGEAASFASTPETIRDALTAGNFETAFIQAETLETAEGYALAAESLLSEIMLGQAKKNKKQAKRARKLAEAGLELDPSNQNARLQYALADGFVARETGDVSAWMKKIPQKTQAIVEAYRRDFPHDTRGDALLGAWHLGVAQRAGSKNAKKWFGADVAEGRALYQSARADQPDDIVIAVNYAFSLLALKEEDLSDLAEVRELLRVVSLITPKDHMGQVLKNYGAEASNKIDSRDLLRGYAEMFLSGQVPEFPSAED